MKSPRRDGRLSDLPNVGPRVTTIYRRLGIESPAQLHDRDPLELYRRLGEVDGFMQDPCVLDTFLAVRS